MHSDARLLSQRATAHCSRQSRRASSQRTRTSSTSSRCSRSPDRLSSSLLVAGSLQVQSVSIQMARVQAVSLGDEEGGESLARAVVASVPWPASESAMDGGAWQSVGRCTARVLGWNSLRTVEDSNRLSRLAELEPNIERCFTPVEGRSDCRTQLRCDKGCLALPPFPRRTLPPALDSTCYQNGRPRIRAWEMRRLGPVPLARFRRKDERFSSFVALVPSRTRPVEPQQYPQPSSQNRCITFSRLRPSESIHRSSPGPSVSQAFLFSLSSFSLPRLSLD